MFQWLGNAFTQFVTAISGIAGKEYTFLRGIAVAHPFYGLLALALLGSAVIVGLHAEEAARRRKK